jgi:multiple sugar transport system substrate-binding protein
MSAPELPTENSGTGPDRRAVLKGLGVGAAGVAAVPFLAACGKSATKSGGTSSSAAGTAAGTSAGSSSAAGGGGGGKSTTLGSNASDPVPKKALAAMISAYQAKSGNKVTVNTVAHNDFQEKINNYLQGSPADVFTWFAGYRMKSYAKKGLVAPIDDVWDKLGKDNFGQGIVTASTGDDGKMYFVPNYNYPWAIFYRKSLWQAKGYKEPKTFDEWKTLCAQMKKDGLAPIAFADKDGWPAMGTFDYLNMRLNGYQFHVDLMAHKESWDQQKVKDVFDNWKSILPYHDTNALGRTWQEAAQTVVAKKSGMYVLGAFVAQQFTKPADLADLDFFPFPTMNEANGQDAVEAPIDGFMLSKKGAKNDTAKDLLAFLGSPEGQNAYAKVDPSNIATNKKADLSHLNPLQAKSQKLIASAKYISQFLDRDALPAFASNVMIPALQSFIKNGSVDTKNLESQAKALYV